MANKKSKSNPLFGITPAEGKAYVNTAKEGGLLLLAAIVAGGAGAALGRHSLLAGIPVTLVGIHKNNKYLVAAGIGLAVSNGFQVPGKTPGVSGFEPKQIAQDAKDRVGTFFQNFKEKLYLSSPASSGTSGLGEQREDEQVTYFINPYSGAGELDMSAIDRVQEEIAEMSTPTSGLEDVDREF